MTYRHSKDVVTENGRLVGLVLEAVIEEPKCSLILKRILLKRD